MIKTKSEGGSVLLNTVPKYPAIKEPKNDNSEVLVSYEDRWSMDSFESQSLPEYKLVHIKGTYSK